MHEMAPCASHANIVPTVKLQTSCLPPEAIGTTFADVDSDQFTHEQIPVDDLKLIMEQQLESITTSTVKNQRLIPASSFTLLTYISGAQSVSILLSSEVSTRFSRNSDLQDVYIYQQQPWVVILEDWCFFMIRGGRDCAE